MRKATPTLLPSLAELVAIGAAGALAASIPFWLPRVLDAYTLAFLGDALMRMLCF